VVLQGHVWIEVKFVLIIHVLKPAVGTHFYFFVGQSCVVLWFNLNLNFGVSYKSHVIGYVYGLVLFWKSIKYLCIIEVCCHFSCVIWKLYVGLAKGMVCLMFYPMSNA